MALVVADPGAAAQVGDGETMARDSNTPQHFAKEICDALPGQVQSIVLFGSATVGDFVEGMSDYDILIILNQVTIKELDILAPAIQRWYRWGNPLPLVFAANEMDLSVDTFATEFLEMKHSRRVLFGTDPIEMMDIHPTHVRIHLERELKGKLLALRNRYTLAAGHSRQIRQLMIESFSTFLTLFRLTLWLFQPGHHQPDIPKTKMDALKELSQHFPVNIEPFITIDSLRKPGNRVRIADVHALFNDYCVSVETIVHAIDKQIHPAS